MSTTESDRTSDSSPSTSPATSWALVTGSTSGIGRETAEVARFLVSSRASYVQGATLAVDDGKTAVVAM